MSGYHASASNFRQGCHENAPSFTMYKFMEQARDHDMAQSYANQGSFQNVHLKYGWIKTRRKTTLLQNDGRKERQKDYQHVFLFIHRSKVE